MASQKKTKAKKSVETIRHEEANRVNYPYGRIPVGDVGY